MRRRIVPIKNISQLYKWKTSALNVARHTVSLVKFYGVLFKLAGLSSFLKTVKFLKTLPVDNARTYGEFGSRVTRTAENIVCANHEPLVILPRYDRRGP